MTFSGEHGIPLSSAPTFVVTRQRGDDSAWLFLSLYLLLFAFFMVLISFSTFETSKRDAVVSSIQGVFATTSGPSIENKLGGIYGTESQARRFQDAVTDIFDTAIPLSNIQIVVAGTRMDVDVPTQVFFNDDSVVVRDPLPMLDRVVATISSPPDGVVYELAIIGYVPGNQNDPLPTDMTSHVARVGNIARALDAKGMPPHAVSIGMERGSDRFVRFVFFAIEERDAAKSTLSLWGEGAL